LGSFGKLDGGRCVSTCFVPKGGFIPLRQVFVSGAAHEKNLGDAFGQADGGLKVERTSCLFAGASSLPILLPNSQDGSSTEAHAK
jgi:hypothetical protein